MDEKALYAACDAVLLDWFDNRLEPHEVRRVIVTAAVRAYLQALSPGSTGETEVWRDIKSDPPSMDGTAVDLWHREFGRHTHCYWGVPEHCCGEAGRYCDSDWHSLEAGWVDGALNVELDASEFTHWRPLPAPPSAMLSAAGER